MAVKQTTAPRTNQHSLLMRGVMGSVCLVFLGWLLLFVWSLYLWVRNDFSSTYTEVERLKRQQASLIAELTEFAFIKQLSAQLQQATTPLSEHADKAKGRLTQWVAPLWQAVAGERIHEELSLGLDDVRRQSTQFFLLLKATGQVLFIKLTLLIAALPLFALSLTAGLVDGLNQRAIRTASLGRESTYVFHKSIPFARKTLLLVLGLWLALPIALPPSPLFVGLSVLLSWVVSMSASRFKKYL